MKCEWKWCVLLSSSFRVISWFHHILFWLPNENVPERVYPLAWIDHVRWSRGVVLMSCYKGKCSPYCQHHLKLPALSLSTLPLWSRGYGWGPGNQTAKWLRSSLSHSACACSRLALINTSWSIKELDDSMTALNESLVAGNSMQCLIPRVVESQHK